MLKILIITIVILLVVAVALIPIRIKFPALNSTIIATQIGLVAVCVVLWLCSPNNLYGIYKNHHTLSTKKEQLVKAQADLSTKLEYVIEKQQGIELETFKDVDSFITLNYPTLKTNELVSKQIDIYLSIKNELVDINNKIIDSDYEYNFWFN